MTNNSLFMSKIDRKWSIMNFNATKRFVSDDLKVPIKVKLPRVQYTIWYYAFAMFCVNITLNDLSR